MSASVVGVCAALAISGCGGGSPKPVPNRETLLPGFPDTWDNIHLGIAFDYRAYNTEAVARSVDYIYGGYFIDWNFGIDPKVPHIDGYLPFDTDGFSQTDPGHSLRDLRARHPDWIVYRCDRKTPAYSGANHAQVPLDFTNPAVRAWQLREVAALVAKGASGIAFDDFTFDNFGGRCGVYRRGVWAPLGYPGVGQQNARYTADMLTWLRDMSKALDRRFPRITITLATNVMASGISNVERAAPYVDMVFDEGGFTSYGTQDLVDGTWNEEVDLLDYLNSHNKAFDVNGIVAAPSNADVTPAEINWVLANYLLVKGSHSYTYVYAGNRGGSTGSASTYGQFYDRPQYHVPIGRPTTGRFESDGVQMRYFSGGLAIVNPSSSDAYTVLLGGTYRDLFGNAVTTTLTLPPTTAVVLLGG